MIKAVATHTLGVRVRPRRKNQEYTRREADEEVAANASWLRRRAREVTRGGRVADDPLDAAAQHGAGRIGGA